MFEKKNYRIKEYSFKVMALRSGNKLQDQIVRVKNLLTQTELHKH